VAAATKARAFVGRAAGHGTRDGAAGSDVPAAVETLRAWLSDWDDEELAMLRELDERMGANLRVTLNWDDRDDTLTVAVEDFKSPDRARDLFGIPPADAKLAFEHPFAYAPSAP
jgi:hypothetical protein